MIGLRLRASSFPALFPEVSSCERLRFKSRRLPETITLLAHDKNLFTKSSQFVLLTFERMYANIMERGVKSKLLRKAVETTVKSGPDCLWGVVTCCRRGLFSPSFR